MIYIGIDPGSSGGIAVLDKDTRELIAVHRLSKLTEKDIANVFFELKQHLCIACIEKVWSFPGQGVASSFKFGQAYGFLRGVIIAAGIPLYEVSSMKWQGALGLQKKDKDESKTVHKNKLRARAQQLYPDIKITLEEADAILIAEYAKFTF